MMALAAAAPTLRIMPDQEGSEAGQGPGYLFYFTLFLLVFLLLMLHHRIQFSTDLYYISS